MIKATELRIQKYQDSSYLVCENGFIINEKTGKQLRPQNNGNGYLKVSLRINKKECQKYVHRLVAECFIEKTSDQVNHKDGNKSNNHVSNLEWVTNAENQVHAHKTGLKNNGNQLWNGKFSEEQINEIFNLKETGMKQYLIAEKMNVTKSTICEILSGKRYKYALTGQELEIKK